jgi:hypothetical protein
MPQRMADQQESWNTGRGVGGALASCTHHVYKSIQEPPELNILKATINVTDSYSTHHVI